MVDKTRTMYFRSSSAIFLVSRFFSVLSLNNGMGNGCGILGYKKNNMIKEITETKKKTNFATSTWRSFRSRYLSDQLHEIGANIGMKHGILLSNILLLVSSDQLSLHLQIH